MTIDFLNAWTKVPKTLDGVKSGDPLAYLKVANEINTFKFTQMYAKTTLDGAKSFHANVMQNGLEGATRSAFQNAGSHFWSGWSQANNVTMFRGIPWEGVHNSIPSSLRFLNGSMLETSIGKGIVSKLGGQVAFSGGANAFNSTATVTGSTAARVAGKSLARVPILGILISTAFEIPDLVDAWKNGDFGAQVGRSALNVGCATAGAAIGAAIGSAIPVVGTIIGGFIGGMVGNFVGKTLGKLFFGKSIKEKMRSGEQASSLMKTYSKINFNNIGNGQSIYGGPIQSNNAGGNVADVDVSGLMNMINQGMARYQ